MLKQLVDGLDMAKHHRAACPPCQGCGTVSAASSHSSVSVLPTDYSFAAVGEDFAAAPGTLLQTGLHEAG
jgi:hypothetical protein